MRDDPLFLLMAAVMIGVVVILMIGIGGFAKGGEFNRKYGNKLMQLRVAAQFIAVLLILLFVWLRSGG
ncbi:twin transmembrane helix small protein [Thalassococcus profundi]|uniref:Twin transmembrane helix small protein n=1 Tax=Thalassococcus profundi TaxID=2282382 RepID=A0A369TRJ4_9RHOB|nr:twin transmembrane helix small protein [Thalassococcus profundi]RDD67909.1 twin transmembrane helix small protein [Thalassococcus profundi]